MLLKYTFLANYRLPFKVNNLKSTKHNKIFLFIYIYLRFLGFLTIYTGINSYLSYMTENYLPNLKQNIMKVIQTIH